MSNLSRRKTEFRLIPFVPKMPYKRGHGNQQVSRNKGPHQGEVLTIELDKAQDDTASLNSYISPPSLLSALPQMVDRTTMHSCCEFRLHDSSSCSIIVVFTLLTWISYTYNRRSLFYDLS